MSLEANAACAFQEVSLLSDAPRSASVRPRAGVGQGMGLFLKRSLPPQRMVVRSGVGLLRLFLVVARLQHLQRAQVPGGL